MARGAPAARHDRVSFLGKHLPGRGRTGPRRGDRSRSSRRRLFRASHPAVEGRVSPARLDADQRPAADDPRRHAAYRHDRERPRPHRVLQGRAGRACRPAAAPRYGAGRARARLPAGLALHPVLVRSDQGPGEPAARRQWHVHGPVRHPAVPGAADAARQRQRPRAHPPPRREDPRRTGRLPLQGLHGHHAGGADAAEDRAVQARHVPGRDGRPGPGRHPVHVPPPRIRRMNTYVCRYCRQPSDPSQPTCPLCGAPVDIRESVSDSGWIEQPPIKDMARLQFGQSHCQIAGTTVPAAEFNLAQGDMVYFSHHVLLWADPGTRMQNMSLRGGWKRMMAGMPLIMIEAHGPGHIALSDNHAGEVIALPLQHGQSMWVKEHRFLTATGNIRYDWGSNDVWYVTGDSDEQEYHYPMGQYGDIFTAAERPGLLLLHAPGNAFIRDLQQGESLLVQPSSLIYRDLSVRVHLHLEYPRNMGFSFWRNNWDYRNILVRLVGPGRVAVNSIFERPEGIEAIRNHSYATRRRW